MNERVFRELERSFPGSSLGKARLRFDSDETALLAPSSTEEFCEAIALARKERWVVVPTGLGSKLARERAPARADLLLSTRRYTGVVAYEPGDGTLTARAGSTMAELRAQVASGGHFLTPDVPRPEGSTLGGVIGAAQSGSDRLRYGSVREHVLGLQVALGDGTLARSGGRLVKNVTGYDLQRLFTGSQGSLCLILEASMRLFPLPEEECFAAASAVDRVQMLRLSTAVLDAPLKPISLCATRPDAAKDAWSVSLRLGGRREVVDDERATLARIWPGVSVLSGDQARRAALLARDEDRGAEDGVSLQVDVRPSALEAALALVERIVVSAENFQASWRCEPGLARIDVLLRPMRSEPGRLSRTLSSLRVELAGLAGRARLSNVPRDVPIDAPEIRPPVRALMRSIQARLDPDGVFDSGRFVESR
ncbi:MAG: FAD-binding oxidoreductase [Planctomycetota bacterium]